MANICWNVRVKIRTSDICACKAKRAKYTNEQKLSSTKSAPNIQQRIAANLYPSTVADLGHAAPCAPSPSMKMHAAEAVAGSPMKIAKQRFASYSAAAVL